MPVTSDVDGVGVGVLVWLCTLFVVACVVALRFLDVLEEVVGPVAFAVAGAVECASLLVVWELVVLESSAAAPLRELDTVALFASPVPLVAAFACRMPFLGSSSFFSGNASSISTSRSSA